MDDSKIIDLYWSRSEQAITETRRKYGRYCHYIAARVLGNDADAEETVSDTYLKAWSTIPPNRPSSLKAYVGMLVRQLSFDAWEARTAQKRCSQTTLTLEELQECIPDGSPDPVDGIALRDALNRFLRTLPPRTRRIFLRRYWYAATVREIAAEFGMTEGAVTVLMLRTRQKLKEFLQKEELIL